MVRYIDEFHILYEKSRIWETNSWFKIPFWKLPFDAMVIQELIVDKRPDFIVETGTGIGGSAMYYASICHLLGHGDIVTCDIEKRYDDEAIREWDFSDRITFIHGSSINPLTVKRIKEIVNENCLVILDSWHTADHVYEEMQLYSDLVPVGGYMIVEDSHAAGNPVPWDWPDDGPMGAINRWLFEKENWEEDLSCEKHLMTFNPKGYLRRTS